MFKNLSILSRLIILVSVLILALLFNVLIAWHGFQEVTEGLHRVYKGGINETSKLFELRGLSEEIVDTVQKVRDDASTWKEAEDFLKEAFNKYDTIWASYLSQINLDYGSVEKMNFEAHNQIEALQRLIREAKPVFDRILNMIKQQDKEAMTRFASQELYPFIDPMASVLTTLIHWHIADTQKDYENAKEILAHHFKLRMVIFVLALIIASVVALLVTSSITKPLKIAIGTLKSLAMGEIKDVAIPQTDTHTKYEIGHLFEAMREMVNYNRKVVETLASFSLGELNLQVDPRSEKDLLAKSINHMIDSSKKMSEVLTSLTKGDLNVSVQPRSDRDSLGLALVSMTKKLRQIIGNIQSDVVSLTNSSQEIIVSVSQVATGSSETAASVAETTTTVEELKQTAQVSAEKAKEVLTSVEDTLQIVKNSEKSLQNTIEDMEQINEKMHNISIGIIKLSELGQTIGQIIDTVNDLAEQSNLLAVNAAIEAAKAGEHGKGFGVVAQEIRTLSEQSKGATIQVRAILSDIQNATNAAVLATEQGSKAVDKGVTQSIQTNESMRILLEGMAQMTQAANQITISSQQQLIGVDQVTVAMNSINEAANQHVENMKKIEKAILALNSIGKTLKQIIDQFKLGELHSFSTESDNQLLVEKDEERMLSRYSNKEFSYPS